MSKKIELKPVPLNPEPIRKSIDTEAQTNPISKRDFPQFELVLAEEESSKAQQLAGADHHARGGRKRDKQPERQRPVVPDLSTFEFELSEEQLSHIQQTSKEFRALECMRLVFNTVYQQSDGYFKENPTLKKYFDNYAREIGNRFDQFHEERVQQVASIVTQKKASELTEDRPERDRFELRKNEAISELILENQRIWDRKVQMELHGFATPTYERYLRLLQQRSLFKTTLVGKDLIEVKLQQMTARIGAKSLVNYEQAKKHVNVRETQVDDNSFKYQRIVQNAQKTTRKFLKIQRMLATLMDNHRAKEFGDRSEYELWRLGDVFVFRD